MAEVINSIIELTQMGYNIIFSSALLFLIQQSVFYNFVPCLCYVISFRIFGTLPL